MNRYVVPGLVAGLVFFTCVPSQGDEPALKPLNLEKLNSDKDEDDPHIASNGLSLFYSSTTKDRTEVLLSVRRTSSAAWQAGKPLPELKGKADYRSVFLTPDGRFPQYLYFATNKDPEKKNRGDNYDIYFLIRQFANAEFTTETGMRVCSERDEMHPWLTANGQALYFSRKDKDGWKLFVTRKPPEGGQWGKEESVNFPVGFHHATLNPAGTVMYLQGPLEKERWGLFRSTSKGKSWSTPEPLTSLNQAEAPKGDMSPCLSRDGALLYFASDRRRGKGGLDLWAIQTAQLEKKK